MEYVSLTIGFAVSLGHITSAVGSNMVHISSGNACDGAFPTPILADARSPLLRAFRASWVEHPRASPGQARTDPDMATRPFGLRKAGGNGRVGRRDFF